VTETDARNRPDQCASAQPPGKSVHVTLGDDGLVASGDRRDCGEGLGGGRRRETGM
jgi:hypothetical protein